LLRGLRDLEPVDAGAHLVSIIVVDNDPEGSAYSVVEAECDQSSIPISYSIEPVPGVAAARNRVVEMASDSRLLAFVDDDEETTVGWLRRMVSLQMNTGAQLVAGPTISVLPQEAPRWIRDGRIFERPRMKTGSAFRFAGTGNLLVDLQGTAELFPLFDLGYGILGGEDTDLFLRAAAAGLTMLWCDEAVVHEAVPKSRTTAAWVLKRAFRTGNTVALCESGTADGRRRRRLLTARFAKAVAHVGQGAAECLVGLTLLNPGAAVAGVCRVVNSAGMLAGVFGIRYAEYRRKARPTGGTNGQRHETTS
jgi:GT2 family glycosyltransferase